MQLLLWWQISLLFQLFVKVIAVVYLFVGIVLLLGKLSQWIEYFELVQSFRSKFAMIIKYCVLIYIGGIWSIILYWLITEGCYSWLILLRVLIWNRKRTILLWLLLLWLKWLLLQWLLLLWELHWVLLLL